MRNTAPDRSPWRDLALLFAGAFAQWALAAAFTRAVVLGGALEVFVAVFVAQSLWWINIRQTTREASWVRWFVWCMGAAAGAVAGKVLSS